ncbi:MAG TPA: hypothetical protein VEE82_01780 [Thermodesulfovibrionales bacterium]|nr:hypothetical protein [Thermodesulfovibrionales bacterium]
MRHKKILIFDEHRFARVCSAFLESAGYDAEIVTTLDGLPSSLNCEKVGLMITSYPFGPPLFEEIRKRGIILSVSDENAYPFTTRSDFNSSDHDWQSISLANVPDNPTHSAFFLGEPLKTDLKFLPSLKQD